MNVARVRIGRMDDSDDQPSVVGEIGRAAMSVVAPAVEETVSVVVLGVVCILVIPIGFVAFVATGAIYGVLMTVLGTPTGTLGSILGLTWFGGTLVLLFALLVFIYRRLPRRPREPSQAPARPTAPRAAATRRPTIAELDARFAPNPTLKPKDPTAGS